MFSLWFKDYISIHFKYRLSHTESRKRLESIAGSSGHTLDMVATKSHTNSHTTDNLTLELRDGDTTCCTTMPPF